MSGSVYNVGSSNTLFTTGSGSDTIYNSYASVTIDAGDGNDIVENLNAGSLVSILGGDGDDSIANYRDQNTLIGGAGNDTIYNYVGRYTTIDGGDDSDVIINDSSHNVSISGGDGNDSIQTDSSSNVIINAGSGDDSIQNRHYGSNVNIYGESGNDTIYSWYTDDSTIDGGIGDDYLEIYETENVLVLGGDGNDVIQSGSDINATLDAGAGNDSIYNSGSNAIVTGGSGNDSIINDGKSVEIYGDSGDDWIENFGEDVTIAGGSGIDTLIGQDSIAETFIHESDINIIYGFGSGDSVSISSGSITSSIVSGSDLLFTTSDGSIVLKNTSIDEVLIDGNLLTFGSNPIDTTPASLLTATSLNDSIYVDGSFATILSGSDSSIVYLDSNVIIDAGSGNDLVENLSGSHVTMNGGTGIDTLIGQDSIAETFIHESDINIIYGFGSGDSVSISSGSITSSIVSGSDLLFTTSNGSIVLKNTSINEVLIDGDLVTFGSIAPTSLVTATSLNDSIYVDGNIATILSGSDSSMLYLDSNVIIDAGSGNDFIENLGSSSVTMIGGAGDDTLAGFDGGIDVFQYLAGDGNDLIQNFGSEDVLSISSENLVMSVASGSDLILSVGNESITVEGIGSQSINIIGSFGSFGGSDGSDGSDINPSIGSDGVISIPSDEYSLTTAGSNDSIFNSYSSVTIDSGSGDDSIFTSGKYSSIITGDGNDTVLSYGAFSTISTGDGDDLVRNIANSTMNELGDHVTIETGGGNDSIYNYYGHYISMDAGSGNDSIYNASNGYGATLIGGDGDDTIYNAATGVLIEGGSGDDSIINDGGGTIDAGLGDDTIIGNNSRSEVFIYSTGDGNDVIQNFGSEDTFSLASGSINSSLLSGSTLILGIGDSSITLEGTGAQTFGQGSTGSSGSNFGLGLIFDDEVVSGSVSSTVTLGSSEAVVSVNSDSASLVATSNDDLTLGFFSGAVSNWNATLAAGNDELVIADVTRGNFNSGSGTDFFYVSSLLAGNITLTGGADGNIFYAQAESVSSSHSQNRITMTDIDFDGGDVIFVDAGIENLTSDFFGNGIFYNYANAEDASTDGVFAQNILDASNLVKDLGMTFSMVRMADATVLGDSIDEDDLVNVVWANSKSTTINFENQTDSTLIFTNTNGRRGDSVNLVGEFDDTLIVGAYDTVNAGDGNDVISVDSGTNGKKAVINSGDGNDTIYAGTHTHIVFDTNAEGNDLVLNWNSGDVVDLESIPSNVSIDGSGNLVLHSDNGTLTLTMETGSFDSSTNVSININGSDGILRVAGSDHEVTYSHEVTMYDGGSNGTLLIDTNRSVEVDLNTDAFQNIIDIDAGSATGYMNLSGNSGSNVIRGGKHASTLWGGGGDDSLVGGDGSDVFRFDLEDGNVTISGAGSNDIVDMSSFTVDDVAGWEFTSAGVVIATTSDQSLTVDGKDMTIFSLNGGIYTADFENQSWNS